MIKNLNKKNKKKGFTLIELIIVIAIIAILAAIAIPKFGEIRKNANVKTDIANAKTIQAAVSTGIAEEKVILPTSKTYYPISGVGEAPTGVTAVNITNNVDGAAKPKAIQKSQFIVALTTDGNVEVYVVSGETAITATTTEPTGAQKVYPNATTGTYAN